MGWFRRAALVATAILVGWLSSAGAVGAAPALWLVRDQDSEIYLFGTLHALPAGLSWRTPLYDAAYARAHTVWFEADLSGADPRTIGDIVRRYGVDPGAPLSRKLPAADLRALSQQVDLARIDHLRPWAVALMLSVRGAAAGGAQVQKGADLAVTRTATRDAKPMRAFETLEDQARMFASLSNAAEVQYLSDVIREQGRRRARLTLAASGESLQQAWISGDVERLAPGLVGDMRRENPSLYDALLRRRNLAWTDALVRQMAGSGVELVNVGALHLIGEDGLPALLQARGFEVTRVQ
ncbi:TraB/GumN family protein [Phenylobacterium deserti]|uniref:TraB/GumN family protein n=1 Tax=Phenylobacterium deserti TaxID=1914756 RepID=UPI00140419C6|nr:TraB/GumN family protein [Phenylobacterium deserti]